MAPESRVKGRNSRAPNVTKTGRMQRHCDLRVMLTTNDVSVRPVLNNKSQSVRSALAPLSKCAHHHKTDQQSTHCQDQSLPDRKKELGVEKRLFPVISNIVSPRGDTPREGYLPSPKSDRSPSEIDSERIVIERQGKRQTKALNMANP